MISILKAIEVAALAHGEQKRKWSNDPFIVHPIRVMRRVCQYINTTPQGFKFKPIEERMLIVCALHDVIEDTAYDPLKIMEQFGAEVLSHVQFLTNVSKQHKDKSRVVRKQMDRDYIATIPLEDKIIKLHDRWDNIADMTGMDEKGKRFTRDIYIPETRLLLEVLSSADPELTRNVTSVVNTLESSLT